MHINHSEKHSILNPNQVLSALRVGLLPILMQGLVHFDKGSKQTDVKYGVEDIGIGLAAEAEAGFKPNHK